VEVVSDEEMALIDAVLAAAATAGARPLLSSAARCAATPLSYAAYIATDGDIEDSPLSRRGAGKTGGATPREWPPGRAR
jgi:exonuclease V